MMSAVKKRMRKTLEFIQSTSLSAVLRFFTSRKKHYDRVLAELQDFTESISADVIDVSGDEGVERPKNSGGKKSGNAVSDVTLGLHNHNAAMVLKEFQAPDRKELSKKVSALNKAEDTLEELRGLIARVKDEKDKSSKKFLKEMNEYYDKIVKSVDDSLEALEDLEEKHFPEEFNKLFTSLTKYIKDSLPENSYDGLEASHYMHSTRGQIDPKAPIEFFSYLFIDGLDKEQYNVDTFILVLTGVVQQVSQGPDKKSKYLLVPHITGMPEFMRPGDLDVGEPIAGATKDHKQMLSSMILKVQKILSYNDLARLMNRMPVNVTPNKLMDNGLLDLDGVNDVEVDKDNREIVLTMDVMNKDTVKFELWPDILLIFKKTLRTRKRKVGFDYSLTRKGQKMYMRAYVYQGI